MATSEATSANAAEVNGFAGSNVSELTGMSLTTHFAQPAPGAAYRQLAPVEPLRPAVPSSAFGALRLLFLGMPTVPSKA